VSIPSDSSAKRRLNTVFLDRDGVMNEKMPEGEYVRSVRDLRVLPGVPEAIARLNRAGLRTIVVSNQRGIALGLYTPADVDSIHAAMARELAGHGARVDAFYFCPHDENECTCRKPLTGMFDRASEDFPDVDPHSSAMIGDSLSDIEFGRRLGMLTVFIEGDPERRKPGASRAQEGADFHAASLAEAVSVLLAPRA
jgi:D-glycero-D-manno-heptose 1,7-bisphosphate phosphatase